MEWEVVKGDGVQNSHVLVEQGCRGHAADRIGAGCASSWASVLIV